jgi:nitrogen fixation protein FixH
MMVAVAIATRDRSFAVLPNYYDNAVHWDQDQAKKRASEQLGWKLEIFPAESIDPLGRRNVTLRLTDATGQPLPASIEVSYFHHAHANEPQTLSATTGSDGRASVAAPMRYAGFYDFRCTATAGKQTFTTTLTQFVSTADAGGAVASTEAATARKGVTP